jgi:hypothetical protein
MPSHASLKDIKTRSYVQLFVRDYASDIQSGRDFILAWDGEVFGFEMLKSATGRSFRINCIDVSSYWDNVQSFFFNGLSGSAGTIAMTSTAFDLNGAKIQGFRVEGVIPSKVSYYMNKIQQVMADGTKDFLDALVSIYDDIADVNAFYLCAEERLRITDRIKINSSRSLNKLVKSSEGLEYFQGVMGRSTGYQTLRQTVNDLMGIIFHDSVTVPFPARIEGKPKGIGLPNATTRATTTVGQFIFKPNLFMMPPPMCNVFFPEEYSQFTYSRNFFEEPTRFTYAPELPQRGDGSAPVVLNYKYEPASFANFMAGADSMSAYQGTDDFLIPEGLTIAKYNEVPKPDLGAPEATSTTITSRTGMYQFTTNEELMKGIWSAREGLQPGSGGFMANLSNAGKSDFQEAVARYLFFKKRFQRRTCQVTSAYKISVVPGFPCLILDDSESGQNITAYINSVTHTVSATRGGFTQVTLSYARDVTEQDSSTNHGSKFLIPPWFDEAIFGTIEKVKTVLNKEEQAKADAEAVTNPKVITAGPLTKDDYDLLHVTPQKLNDYFASLLGSKGSQALTLLYDGQNTLRSAVSELLVHYKEQKAKNNADNLDNFIRDLTARDYIKCKDFMGFLGASTTTSKLADAEFVEFTGDLFLRTGKLDQNVVFQRRNVIKSYANAMKTKRGFRG